MLLGLAGMPKAHNAKPCPEQQILEGYNFS